MLDALSQVSDREPKKTEQLHLFVPPYLDASADLSSPHHPRLEKGGDPWFPFTHHHFMTSLKLTPCARLLWDWILLKAPAGTWIEVDLHDFRAVTAEHRRGKPYSMRQIRKAVNELEELQLVAIKSERVRMQARHPGPVVNQKQKSERSEVNFQGRNLSSTPRNLSSTPENLSSKSNSETPVEQGFPNHTDLYRSDQITHIAAPADAAPAPHPNVCVPLETLEKEEKEVQPVNSETTEVKADQDPGFVGELIKDLAQSKDFGFDSNSAAPADKSKKNIQPINQSNKWECPGIAEEKLEFLKWKGSLLVNAGKTSKAEAESAALGWANKHPEEATLAFQGWKREINQESVPAPTPKSLVSTIPNFELKSRTWHKQLITAYHQEGEEAFLKRETWHKNWLKYARTYLRKELER